MRNLPNLSWVVRHWSGPVELIKIESESIDFSIVNSHVAHTILGLIQPTILNQIKIDFVDITRVHMTLHTDSELPKINDYFKYKGDYYRLIFSGPYDDFGFREMVGESCNEGELK